MNGPRLPYLILDLLEGDGGEISGTVIVHDGFGERQGTVEGTYAYPEVRISVIHDRLLFASYTGIRVDDHTIDGEFTFDDKRGAMRLMRPLPETVGM